MDKFWKQLATQKSTEYLMVKLPPVLKGFVATKPNMSQYVIGLIIADYERQAATANKDGE